MFPERGVLLTVPYDTFRFRVGQGHVCRAQYDSGAGWRTDDRISPGNWLKMTLDLARLEGLIDPAGTPWQLRFSPTATSTQDLARQALAEGAGAGLVVLTDYQQAGRGRRGAAWLAPPAQALLFSAILRPPSDMLPLAPLRAGLAVREGVEQATGARLDLKWPNDLMAGGMKVAGILIEHPPGDAIIAGIGVNVNQQAATLAGLPATSLRILQHRPLDREPILARILLALDAWFDPARTGPAVIDAFRRHSTMLGHWIRYHGPRGSEEAIAEALQADGSLLVRHPDGQSRVLTAETVTEVRPAQL
jgi:BirA family biotin operon repressor/biotin-[acetyl-CoA-carboxylase] ligase